MDVVLHCVDPGHLRHRSLSEVFPAISGFPQVSHCLHTRRIATGAKNGAIAIYELRASKCQVSQSVSQSPSSERLSIKRQRAFLSSIAGY